MLTWIRPWSQVPHSHFRQNPDKDILVVRNRHYIAYMNANLDTAMVPHSHFRQNPDTDILVVRNRHYKYTLTSRCSTGKNIFIYTILYFAHIQI